MNWHPEEVDQSLMVVAAKYLGATLLWPMYRTARTQNRLARMQIRGLKFPEIPIRNFSDYQRGTRSDRASRLPVDWELLPLRALEDAAQRRKKVSNSI